MRFFIPIVAFFIAQGTAETTTVYSTRNYRLPTTTSQTDGTIYVTSTRQLAITTTSTTNSGSSSSLSVQTTAVTDCHFHDSVQYCINGYGVEGSIVPAPTNTDAAPTSYEECHSHDDEVFCIYQGNEVQFIAVDEDGLDESESSSGTNCHFHAGVEHCVGGSADVESCERVDRDYNIPLRIGLLFVILVTSAIGSFGPLLLKSWFKLSTDGIIITIIKQFGTGVIISTVFIHLITHAQLMWSNSCLHIVYEGTGAAITMAGLLVAFLLEYFAHRVLKNRVSLTKGHAASTKEEEKQVVEVSSAESVPHGISVNDKISVLIMEAGILFHSILIGVILVVAGDSYFITLFIVIVFHQFFEGLALGSRILSIENAKMHVKLFMAAAFALITPLGMAIGIGVLNKFNGNDPSTIIALGTLDSFSAGILLWTGLIEMWAHDWLHGSLSNSSLWVTLSALTSLIVGMLLMSLLGYWA